MNNLLRNNRGVTMIALVVTIIVIIIITSATMITFSDYGFFNKAKESKFKSDIVLFDQEMRSKFKIEEIRDIEWDKSLINATWNGRENNNIRTWIPSMKEIYKDKVAIVDGKIQYVGSDANEIAWATDLSISTIQGFFANISGIPCVAVNSKNANIENYRIYGNTIRRGGSTPTLPGDIYNLGEKSKNLFDMGSNVDDYIFYSNALKSEMNVSFSDNSLTATSNQYGLSVMIRDKNIPYISGTNLSVHLDVAVTWARVLVRTYDENGNNISSSGNVPTGWTYNQYYQSYYIDLTKWSNSNYRAVFKYINEDVSYIKFGIGFMEPYGDRITISNIQLEEGAVVTSYAPYYDGNKINVEMTGKNLFNKNDSLKWIPSSGTVTQIENGVRLTSISTGNYRVSFYKLDYTKMLGKTFSFKFNSQASSENVPMVSINWCNGNSTISSITGSMFEPKTFTVPSTLPNGTDSIKILFYINLNGTLNVGDYVDFTNIQLEESPSPTDYELYVSPTTTIIDLTGHEPLRKIGDIADYIDYENGQIVRNVGKFVIPSNSNFNGANEDRILLTTARNLVDRDSDIGLSTVWTYSSVFIESSNTCNLYKRNGIFYWYPDVTAFGVNPGEDNVTVKTPAFRNWISLQSERNKTIYYKLKDPIYESIELPTLQTLGGTTKITAHDGQMNASNIDVKYIINN